MKTTKTWTKMLAMVTAAGCSAVATAQQTPPPGYAMQFNGTNAFVQVADNARIDFQRTVTLEAWIKPSSISNTNAEVIGQGDGVNYFTDRAFHFGYDATNATIAGEFFRSDGGIRYAAWCGNAATPTTQWTHICVTFDGTAGVVRVYRNGVLDAERTNQCGNSVAFGAFSVRNSTRPLEIGRRWVTCCMGPGLYFSGLIDEIRIWNTVRTPAEIAASFNTSVPPNSPGLVAYYTFDEGSGATLLDRTGNGLNGQVNGGATWVTVGPICPAVTLQPASTTVCPGTPVTLEAAFSGTPAALQWRRNGEPIAGATAATLTIASPTAADAGTYDCVATNACGSATTAMATLSVPARQILTPPTDQAVNVDQPVVFVVETDAASPCNGALSFQWQRRDPLVSDANAPNAWITLRDGGGVVGSTDPTLVLLRPAPGLATGFRCKITGGCGCEFATSSIHYTATVNFTIACPADFNADGGVDFGDIETFFMRWEDGC